MSDYDYEQPRRGRADDRRAELRAWLDRKPPRDECAACHMPERECWLAVIRCCFDCDHADIKPWEFWFTRDGVYLGERSARTGPDAVTADEKARQAADRRDVQMESGHA